MALLRPGLSGYAARQLAASETLLALEHRHPIVLVAGLLPAAGSIALGVAALVGGITHLDGRYAAVMTPLALVALAAGALLALVTYAVWRFDEYVLTTRRLVRVSGVVSKSVADTALEKINDLVLTQSVWERLLGYGDLQLLTAAEEPRIFSDLADVRGALEFKRRVLEAKFALFDAER